MRILFRIFFLASLSSVLTLSSIAQNITGTIQGRVTDASGAVVPNAKVRINNQETGLVREAPTDAEGTFVLTFVPTGSYEVSIIASGFNTVHKKGVAIDLNKTT